MSMLAFVKLQITLSISMYIKCVILCLFSALSSGVGTLRISVIITDYFECMATDPRRWWGGGVREGIETREMEPRTRHPYVPPTISQSGSE